MAAVSRSVNSAVRRLEERAVNRTTRLKIGYLVALAALAVVSGSAVIAARAGMLGVVAVTVLLLVPGRVQGFYYRDLFTGRRLLDAGRFAEAVSHLERFLESIRLNPRREMLLWLSWSVYTPNVTAMALNNIGIAQLNLGDLDSAEVTLARALDVDPLYPLPHFNIAVIQEMRGNHAGAVRALKTAQELGYSGGTIDAVISKSQSLLARVEGSAS